MKRKSKKSPDTTPKAGQPSSKRSTTKRRRPVNLYWVTTMDHSEDWFIFSRSAKAAKRFHEDYEGYGTGDARTRTVVRNVRLKRYESGRPTCHAQVEDLVRLGFEIVGSPEHQRAVRYRGKLYVEGCIELLVMERRDDIMEVLGSGRPNRTKPTTIQ